MVIAILFNRFAPSSRGLRRADVNTLYGGQSDEYTNYNYSNYNNNYYSNNRYTSQRLSLNNNTTSNSNSNSSSTRAWSKIRNATKIASALGGVRRRRRNVYDSNSNVEQSLLIQQQQFPVPVPIQQSYDDRYYALGYGSGDNNNNNRRTTNSTNSITTGTGTGTGTGTSNVSSRTLFPFRFSQQRITNGTNTPNAGTSVAPVGPVATPIPKTKHRLKQFRAITFVTSVASDLDVIADWIFYHSSIRMDNQYKEQWYEQYGTNTTSTTGSSGYSYSDTDTDTDTTIPPNFMIPPILLRIALITCIVGSILWLVLATDGQIAAPLCRYVGIDRLSMGHVLFACVLLEDIPQIILTITIEEYYVEGRSFSPFALSNIIISCYDMLIKLAEAYDDRNDIVETGVWCKATIPKQEHSNSIISAVAFVPIPLPVPVPVPVPIQQQQQQQQQQPPSIMSLLVSSNDDDDDKTENSDTVSNNRRSSIQMPPMYSPSVMQHQHQHQHTGGNEIEITTPYTNMSTTAAAATSQTNLFLQQQQRLQQQQIQQQQQQQQSLNGLMRFLTISNDKKIRLWETDCMTNNNNRTNVNSMLLCNNTDGTTTCSNYNSRTVSCRKVYKGHTNEVTCITILGSNMDPNEYHLNFHSDIRNNNNKNKSRSIKKGVTTTTTTTTTASSVHSDTSTCSHPTVYDQFVATDTMGTANATLTTYFITGCKSGIAYLWSINHERYICEYVVHDSYAYDSDDDYSNNNNDNYNSKKSTKKKKKKKKPIDKTYCPITSVATIVNEMTFVAAYENGSIRLWDAWTGTCIGLYYHNNSNNNVTAKSNVSTTTTTRTSSDGHKILCCTLEDETLFVSGSSNDTTLHIWDTTSAMDAYDAYLTSSEESLLTTKDNNGQEQSIVLHTTTTTNDGIKEGQLWESNNTTNTTTNRTTTKTVAADACGSPNSKTIPVSSSSSSMDKKSTTTTVHGSDKQYQTHTQLMSMKRLLQSQNQITTSSEAATTTGLSSTVASATTCICCLDPGLAFITGSNDGIARLWSVQTGMCLRIFPIGNVTATINNNNKSSWNIRNTINNNIAITSVRAVDTVTFLTGSNDSTIRLWDAISGSLVRTYNGHEKSITDISVTDDDTSFITSSTDKTVKVWVLSAVSDQTSTINSNSYNNNNNNNNNSIINGGFNNNISNNNNNSVNDIMSINNTPDNNNNNNNPYYYYNNSNNKTYNENENNTFFSNLCHGKDPL